MSFFTKLPRERYASDAFNGFTGGTEFDLANARAMIWMSQLAYETDDEAKIKDILKDWGLVLAPNGVVIEKAETVLPKSSTRCFFATGRGRSFIAFQGTDPVVLANWITDFDARRDPTGVAEGYARAADAVYQKLKELIGQAAPADRNIFITGHSLGGALAVLIASRLIVDGVNVQAVYTYGMPRPADANFAAAYDARLGQRTYRLVHGEDLVPTVAPSDLGFRHVGRYLHCASGQKFDAAQLTPPGVSDEPPFVAGVYKELARIGHAPVSATLGLFARLKLAGSLALGIGPAGMRTDPGGIAIELLPPRVRDHMPDRYIAACGGS